MSVMEILHEIDTLPASERWQVLEHTRHSLEPDEVEKARLLEGIKRGEKAIAEGRVLTHTQAQQRMSRWLR